MLTIDEVDPTAKIPEFKFCAVKIERVGAAANHEPATDAGGGLMAAGNGPTGTAAWACASQPRPPGTEARAGKFPGPSLIPALVAIQREHGWLPREELVKLSQEVRRPLYEIEGLISFYPHFKTDPPRKVHLAVCHDLSCWLHDSDERIAELRARYGEDVEVELHEVSCLGRCDAAPAIAVDEQPASFAQAEELVDAARSGEPPPSRRACGPTGPSRTTPTRLTTSAIACCAAYWAAS